MTSSYVRLNATLPVIAASLWFASAPMAPAQDVMELDLAFKSGRWIGHESEVRPERGGHETRSAQERVEVKKRHLRRHRGQSR